MKTNQGKKFALVAVLILIAVISMTVLTDMATSVDNHGESIKYLDDKKATVMGLTAATAAVSTAITLIPGDTATPIAEKIADLSSYLLIVLCTIFLEKYLLTVTGYVAFFILIPVACVLTGIYIFRRNEAFALLAKKLTAFALVIFLLVPASVRVSNMIEDTYDASVQSTIESAEEITDSAEGGIIKGFNPNIKDKVNSLFNHFVEAIAVMIVTSCLIPIFVLLCFIWLVKSIFGVEIKIPRVNGAKL